LLIIPICYVKLKIIKKDKLQIEILKRNSYLQQQQEQQQ
jgi:hypothetical protein